MNRDNTSSNGYTDLFYAQLNEIFSYKSITDFDLDELILRVRSLEQSTILDDTLIVIFDMRSLNAHYISKNASKVWNGYESDRLLGKGFFSVLNAAIIKEHSHFPLKSLNWFRSSKKDVPISAVVAASKGHQCGLKMKFEEDSCTFLIRTRVIIFDQKNQPIIGVNYINDITHLFKGDFFWGRYTYGQNEEYTKFYTSAETKKIEYKDIISPREKEILVMIANNQDSKQIAKELYISVNTVDKHRKNMLARSGAKDTTALIQLCKLCNVM